MILNPYPSFLVLSIKCTLKIFDKMSGKSLLIHLFKWTAKVTWSKGFPLLYTKRRATELRSSDRLTVKAVSDWHWSDSAVLYVYTRLRIFNTREGLWLCTVTKCRLTQVTPYLKSRWRDWPQTCPACCGRPASTTSWQNVGNVCLCSNPVQMNGVNR